MQLEFTGAAALRKHFAEIQHPARQVEDCITLDHWGLWVRLLLERHDNKSGQQAVTYRTLTYLDRLTHPVVDYAIGWGATLADANAMAAEVYMGSVFPVIHSICCTEHCAYGVECETHYAKGEDSGLVNDWKIIHGPPVMINATPEEIPRTALSDMLEPEVTRITKTPGTYWFKCFVGHFGGNVDADCFLNNFELPEVKQQYIDYGKTIPADSTCKQHVLIMPDDPDVAADYRNARRDEWEDALADLPNDVASADLATVLLGFEVFHDFDGMNEAMIREELERRGLSETVARLVVSFLPSVCARHFLEPKGVTFGEHYHLLNYGTRKSKKLPLNEDSLFRAAKSVVNSWSAKEVAGEVIGTVTEFSAEYNAAMSLLTQHEEAELSGLKMTWLVVPCDDQLDEDTDPQLLDALGLKRRWWQFWKR